jgi:hypothetical protein
MNSKEGKTECPQKNSYDLCINSCTLKFQVLAGFGHYSLIKRWVTMDV